LIHKILKKIYSDQINKFFKKHSSFKGQLMNLKKALKKGLAGITEDDFLNAMKLIATSDNNTETNASDKLLREKYPCLSTTNENVRCCSQRW
jgi:hypothetical protein